MAFETNKKKSKGPSPFLLHCRTTGEKGGSQLACYPDTHKEKGDEIEREG